MLKWLLFGKDRDTSLSNLLGVARALTHEYSQILIRTSYGQSQSKAMPKGFLLERGFKLAVDDRGTVRPTTFPNNQGIAGSRICCDVFTEKSRKLLQLWQR